LSISQCCPHSAIRQYVRLPDADAAEQELEAFPEADDATELDEPDAPPLEADEADTAEQSRDVILDDDEYR
jgi:hypothetical protein